MGLCDKTRWKTSTSLLFRFTFTIAWVGRWEEKTKTNSFLFISACSYWSIGAILHGDRYICGCFGEANQIGDWRSCRCERYGHTSSKKTRNFRQKMIWSSVVFFRWLFNHFKRRFIYVFFHLLSKFQFNRFIPKSATFTLCFLNNWFIAVIMFCFRIIFCILFCVSHDCVHHEKWYDEIRNVNLCRFCTMLRRDKNLQLSLW